MTYSSPSDLRNDKALAAADLAFDIEIANRDLTARGIADLYFEKHPSTPAHAADHQWRVSIVTDRICTISTDATSGENGIYLNQRQVNNARLLIVDRLIRFNFVGHQLTA